MKFTLDRPGTANVIRGHAPGMIRIGTRDLDSSVIVSASTLIAPWRPRRMSELTAEDLEQALALQPAVLLIGSGAEQALPRPDLLAGLYAARIGFEVMTTAAACRTYNVLLAEDRAVVAALLVE